MHLFLYLVLFQVGWGVRCNVLYPDFNSYKQNPKPIRELRFQTVAGGPVQSNDWSMDEQEGDFVRGLSENRMERHVDAIFTNTYRKFLGQISARRYLQNMMGKRLGQEGLDGKGQEPGDNDRTLRDALLAALRDSDVPERREEQPQYYRL
ncbi:somatoliberin [Spea bombifrons]|uniref:somatoliberin n=1 Tax=Spea bombifrons TaxID=233779 RepID=UPI00234B596D|nr:somatoliberin [Spea bombifrons]